MKTLNNLLLVKIIRYINIWLKIRNYEIGRFAIGSFYMDDNYMQVMTFYENKLSNINLDNKISTIIDDYFTNIIVTMLEQMCTDCHKIQL